MRRLLNQLAFVVLPKLLSGGGTALISLMLVHYLAPAYFGTISLCLSGIVIADAVMGSAFDLAAVRLASEIDPASQRSLALQWATMWLKTGSVALAGGLVAIFFPSVNSAFFHGAATKQLLLLTWLACLAVLLLRSAQLNLQLQERFQAYGSLDLVHSVLRVGGIALLARAGAARPITVLALTAAAPFAVFLSWLVTAGRRLPLLSVPTGPLRELTTFARWFLLTFALGTLLGRVDLWFVAHYTNLRDTGIYSAAQVLALIPPMLGTYLSVVLSPRVVRMFREGKLLRFSLQMQALLIGTGVLSYVLALFVLPRLTSLFPGRFHDALPIFLLLLPGSLAGMISFPLTITTLMFLRPRFLFLMDCATAPLILLSYVTLLPRHRLIAAAWIFSCAALGRAVVAQIVSISILRRARHNETELNFPKWTVAPVEPA
jgi:O-antigen/teichoic acid export membrane protein